MSGRSSFFVVHIQERGKIKEQPLLVEFPFNSNTTFIIYFEHFTSKVYISGQNVYINLTNFCLILTFKESRIENWTSTDLQSSQLKGMWNQKGHSTFRFVQLINPVPYTFQAVYQHVWEAFVFCCTHLGTGKKIKEQKLLVEFLFNSSIAFIIYFEHCTFKVNISGQKRQNVQINLTNLCLILTFKESCIENGTSTDLQSLQLKGMWNQKGHSTFRFVYEVTVRSLVKDVYTSLHLCIQLTILR